MRGGGITLKTKIEQVLERCVDMKPGDEKEFELDNAPTLTETTMLTMDSVRLDTPERMFMISHQLGGSNITVSCIKMPTAEDVAVMEM